MGFTSLILHVVSGLICYEFGAQRERSRWLSSARTMQLKTSGSDITATVVKIGGQHYGVVQLSFDDEDQ